MRDKDCCECSNVAKDYLNTFRCILERMIQGMTEAELTDSISHNFIVQMIPHHRAAIEMSQNILRYTTCVPLQEIAEGIVAEQTKSIENMEAIACACGELMNPQQALRCYQRRNDRIMHIMFERMGSAPATNRIDADFMREMIPHHCGAVEMSENALRWDICPELKPILKAIIRSQKRGIEQMCRLLERMGCSQT